MRSTRFMMRHRGAVLVAVLVVLAVSSALLGAMLHAGRQEQQVLRGHQRRLQAIELAEAGLERAAARLSADSRYEGESWHVSAEELGGRHGAVVAIEVEAVADRSRRRHINVEVEYSGGQVKHRLAAPFDLPLEE